MSEVPSTLPKTAASGGSGRKSNRNRGGRGRGRSRGGRGRGQGNRQRDNVGRGVGTAKSNDHTLEGDESVQENFQDMVVEEIVFLPEEKKNGQKHAASRYKEPNPHSNDTEGLLPKKAKMEDERDKDNEKGVLDPSFMTDISFKDLPETVLNKRTLTALTEKMKLQRLTEIQMKTLETLGLLSDAPRLEAARDIDILGRARTGTGKTLGFLLPSLCHVQSTSDIRSSISVLIVSPTRELATQISVQADSILTHQKNKYSVQVMFGGTNIRSDISRLNRAAPTFLVATPGRLKDHLQNTTLTNGQTFASLVRHVQVLVLDEADQLLEMGFRPDILKIISFLPPKEKRQTLLFSATIPKELKTVMAQAMKPSYHTVDCIHDGDSAVETNVQVVQSHIILPSEERTVIGVVEVLLACMASKDAKIIVFFSTARLTAFFADLFTMGLNIPVLSIHSRKSQGRRNQTSEQFRKGGPNQRVLFSSDVSARGVDYPGVTHVIQFGLPDNREQYIHRLGRTGRAGKCGRGWLVLAPYESSFLKELVKGGIACPADDHLAKLFASPPAREVLERFDPVLQSIPSDEKLLKSAELAYCAWLGFYNSNTKRIGGVKKAEVVQMANVFGSLIGLREMPIMLPKTVGKMGLKGVPGLRIAGKNGVPSQPDRAGKGNFRGGGRGK